VSIGDIQARIGQIHAIVIDAQKAVEPKSTASTTTAGAGADFAAQLKSAIEQSSGTAAALPISNTSAAAAIAQRPATASAVLPVKGASVTSEFGPRWGTQHEGMDFAANMGAPVHAAKAGVVRKASWYGGYGNAVIIDHGHGVQTLYGHNSKLLVKEGERVAAGQVISKAGSTGDSTGPHVHFEVHLNDKAVNPRPWLKKNGINL